MLTTNSFGTAVASVLLILSIVLFGYGYSSYKQQVLAEQLAQEVHILKNKTIKNINREHLKCLATNIYHEARNEPYMGQVAVARVVMNRIQHGFASNPCKVIYQAKIIENYNDTGESKKICQFSWVCQGKGVPNRDSSYIQAEKIAKKVLSENYWADVIPSNILFFHSINVSPMWGYNKAMVIGNHVFYKK